VTLLPDRLNRILTMIPTLQRHQGIRVQELAQLLGTDPQTILADLDAVLLCGVPPYLPNDYIGVVLEGDRIYVSFAEHFKRPVNLTFEEALSLGLSLRRLPLPKERRAAAEDLRRKLLALLPGPARRMWREAGRQVDVGRFHKEVEDRIALLRQAIEERRETRIEYYTASRDEMTVRGLRPYGLVEHNGDWYVVGHCLLRDRELPFRVDRIRKLTLCAERFERPKDFAIEKYRRPQMYFPTFRDMRVKLKIAPELARWVADEHPAGKMRRLADGSLILNLPVSQPQWIISWVTAHAGHVELLAPLALRRQIAESCARALAGYAPHHNA